MKKLISSIFTLLLLIPSICYSLGNNTTEKEDLEKLNPPRKDSTPKKPYYDKPGKFIGTDPKRDVALFEDTSKEPLAKRFINLFWGNSSGTQSPKQDIKKH